jgi:hypothetical protein
VAQIDTVHAYSFVGKIPVMDALRPTEWIAKCAERLHARWHTVGTAQLKEIAVDIWKDDALRSMGPVEAAAFWLAPVAVTDTEGQVSHQG